MLYAFVALFLSRIWFVVHFHSAGSSDVCRELHYLDRVVDKALDGHVIKTTKVNEESLCKIRCYMELECVSYNLGPPEVNGGQTCELSKSDHVRHPYDLVPRPGYIYRGTKNRCSSSLCPNNATCLSITPATFQCLCPAGFTGSNCETDVDECQGNQYNCPLYEACNNTVGSYTCTCVSGMHDSNGNCLPGNSCQEIKTAFPHAPNGMYWIQPGSGLSTFLAYCDMMSYGGGWTMCYTTNNLVRLTTEVTYNESLPYGTNSYRTDCNNIQFREILFVDETTGEKAFFSYKINSAIVAMGNYGTQLPGLFVGGGIADTSYYYQLLICDINFYSGFFVSGYTNCFKRCSHWCGDGVSPYFRSASTNAGFGGVAFNANGHRPLNSRLISVGLR